MNTSKNHAQSLASPHNISKLPSNRWTSYKLDKEQDWVGEILMELNEKANALPEQFKMDQTKLDLNLKIQKRFTNEYGEFVLCSGEIETVFFTECVKTLATMKDSLTLSFKSMFLDSSFESMPEYEEQTQAYFDQEVYELYYFERRYVDFKEMIHEVLFLNINPYPTREI